MTSELLTWLVGNLSRDCPHRAGKTGEVNHDTAEASIRPGSAVMGVGSDGLCSSSMLLKESTNVAMTA